MHHCHRCADRVLPTQVVRKRTLRNYVAQVVTRRVGRLRKSAALPNNHEISVGLRMLSPTYPAFSQEEGQDSQQEEIKLR